MLPRSDRETRCMRYCSKRGMLIAGTVIALCASVTRQEAAECIHDEGANSLDAVTLARLQVKAGAP